MQELEFEKFLAAMGLPPWPFTPEHPFSMTLAERYEVTLEYNAEGDIVVLLAVAMPPYEQERLEKALRAASYLNERLLDFTVGYRQDKLLLLTLLPNACTAVALQEEILTLLKQYEQIAEQGSLTTN